jgi:hypothetical protein
MMIGHRLMVSLDLSLKYGSALWHNPHITYCLPAFEELSQKMAH